MGVFVVDEATSPKEEVAAKKSRPGTKPERLVALTTTVALKQDKALEIRLTKLASHQSSLIVRECY